jgi:hypothetical protein
MKPSTQNYYAPIDKEFLLSICNSGQDISDTNFWDSEIASRGFTFLSWNAGAARLMVPDR